MYVGIYTFHVVYDFNLPEHKTFQTNANQNST